MKNSFALIVFLFSVSVLAQSSHPIDTEAEFSDVGITNLYEIDKGRYFRSAQLSKANLEKLVRESGIKTIINLRGENVGEKWFDDEAQVVKEWGIQHINISMSADRLPHRKDLLKLLDAFRTAERPLLVHCKAGADRTGEASAIYQMLYMGKSRKDAMKMLSPFYLHLSLTKPAKDYFVQSVWQNEQWAYDSYDPCKADYKYYDKNSEHCK
jgi:protein tyrosine/serine phosphatase